MSQLKSSIFVCALLSSAMSFAECNSHLNKLNYCPLTKATINDYEPAQFEPTNNLLKKVGQEELYCGEKIIVRGRVLDENCVPIPDAKIYAWQANCSGKYPYKTLKNAIDQDLSVIDEDTTFTGNGTAITNNNGEFYFITVYPPSMHDVPSHLNIRVEDRRLGVLQTSLGLRGKKIDNPELDPELETISDIGIENSIYNFEIVLPGEGLKSY